MRASVHVNSYIALHLIDFSTNASTHRFAPHRYTTCTSFDNTCCTDTMHCRARTLLRMRRMMCCWQDSLRPVVWVYMGVVTRSYSLPLCRCGKGVGEGVRGGRRGILRVHGFYWQLCAHPVPGFSSLVFITCSHNNNTANTIPY